MNIERLSLDNHVINHMKDKELNKNSNNEEIEEATTLETEDMSCSSRSGCSNDSSTSTITSSDKAVIEVKLHTELRGHLTQGQVNRISFYNVILEINKGIALMADKSEECPVAAIDEEEWLLAAIRHRPRHTSDTHQEEGDQSTILWKPIGSWWEARSKKNPKIGIKNHNKRWSYLWPMINYHKFLAQCIKKLKKPSLDDTDNNSSSTILTLLQEELNNISRQISKASLFTGPQWTRKLVFYRGWISTKSSDEELLRSIVWDLQFVSIGQEQPEPIQRRYVDKHISDVIQKAKEEYKFEIVENEHELNTIQEQRPKHMKKKSSTRRYRKSSSTVSLRSNDTRKTLNHSRSMPQEKKFHQSESSYDSTSPEESGSVCSTNGSSCFSPVMGTPLLQPMGIAQNQVVASPNVPLACAFPNVICETRIYHSLPSMMPMTGPLQPPPPDHQSHHNLNGVTPGFLHPDGSVHYPLPQDYCSSIHDHQQTAASNNTEQSSTKT